MSGDLRKAGGTNSKGMRHPVSFAAITELKEVWEHAKQGLVNLNVKGCGEKGVDVADAADVCCRADADAGVVCNMA